MSAQITDILWQYDVNSALYTEYDMKEKAFKYLLIATVDETYIQSLWDKYIGYAKIDNKEMRRTFTLLMQKNWMGISRKTTSVYAPITT